MLHTDLLIGSKLGVDQTFLRCEELDLSGVLQKVHELMTFDASSPQTRIHPLCVLHRLLKGGKKESENESDRA